MKATIYTWGVCSLSCCAPKEMTREEIENSVNEQQPTGIDSKWKISTDQTFSSGKPMPNQCEQESNNQHWLLHC